MWQGKGSRHERGYGASWVKARDATLRRDRYLCQACLAAGNITTATEVDHIIPKAKGGTDDEANLQSMCHDCHAAKTAQEAAEAQGKRVRPRTKYDRDGFPIW